ncbi:Fatty acyl-CoA elongase/Polyunsaturated fatty acid specific elongation enzyme, partial [Spiromyces aspiralis]
MLRPSQILDTLVAPLGIAPDHWRWEPGLTPLSTWHSVLAGFAGYLAMVFGGKHIMRSLPPFRSRTADMLHNAFLTLASAFLFALYIEELLPVWRLHGIVPALCHPDSWSPRLVFLHYLNYLTKWYEFVDTLFLVLKKKPTRFLHVFHHSMTMVLTFSQIRGMNAVSWGPIVLNLLVHVLMYYYYFLASRGIRVWWKQYITVMQIAQFVIDVFMIHYFVYHLYLAPRLGLPHIKSCQGTISSAIFGC